jgi:hypothetical protein
VTRQCSRWSATQASGASDPRTPLKMSNRERGPPSARPSTPNPRQLAPNVGQSAVVAAPPTVHHRANTMMQLIDFTDSTGPPPLTPYDVLSTAPSTVVRSPVSSTHPSLMDSAMRTRRHALNPFLDQTADDQTWLQADSLLQSSSRPAFIRRKSPTASFIRTNV